LDVSSRSKVRRIHSLRAVGRESVASHETPSDDAPYSGGQTAEKELERSHGNLSLIVRF
jgi:hypothetical protein